MFLKEPKMYDTIRGPVLDVIDGDTFDISVTHTGKNNKYTYGDSERIRIVDINAPELNTPDGLRAKTNLKAKILGKEIRCHVHTRDSYQRLVGDVV
jgi:endonuclease YncB( thermonuclease family)